MATDQERIRGQVATILNVREVALNIGADKGVQVGMRFNVLDKPITIVDPNNDKVLGTVTDIKRQLEVTRLEDHYSIASTLSERVTVGGGFDLDMSRLYGPRKVITRYETLKKTDADDKPEHIDESESIVKVGDPVVQVVRSEIAPPQEAAAKKRERVERRKVAAGGLKG